MQIDSWTRAPNGNDDKCDSSTADLFAPLHARRARIIPTQDAGPKGRVARGAKPSCSLTRRPALSVARGMRNAMGISVSRRKSGRNQYAGDEAQPIGAVRMSESTRASPLVPPALRAASCVDCGELRAAGVSGTRRVARRAARGWRAWDAANCARMACVGCGELRAAGVRGTRRAARAWAAATGARLACVGRGELRGGRAPLTRTASRLTPATRCTPIPAQDAGPEGRVARGAKPSCSLTRRPALSVERGMRNVMGEA